MAAKLPSLKWAQRKASVFVTVELADVTGEQISIEENVVHFRGHTSSGEYKCDLELFAPIDKDDKACIYFNLVKKDQDAPYWPQLLKNKALAKTFVKIDWSRYIDEDDEGSESKARDFDMDGMGGMDFSKFGGMDGMDMPHHDHDHCDCHDPACADCDCDSDDDDDDLPDMDEKPEEESTTETA